MWVCLVDLIHEPNLIDEPRGAAAIEARLNSGGRMCSGALGVVNDSHMCVCPCIADSASTVCTWVCV